jgi:1-aminocyclopropane-1-carboxylate deaminase/D-cysteine desulfhydrase-like pyridoxal-dependent ACC family enzyme
MARSDRVEQSSVISSDLIMKSRNVIARSRLRIETSSERIRRTGRRLLPVISGGATEEAGSEQLRARVREVIATLPTRPSRICAGYSNGGTRCHICGAEIVRGAMEYEAEFGAFVVCLDRRRFAAWRRELTAN